MGSAFRRLFLLRDAEHVVRNVGEEVELVWLCRIAMDWFSGDGIGTMH